MTVHHRQTLPPIKPLTREELEDGVVRHQILSIPGPPPPPPPPVLAPDASLRARFDDYRNKLSSRDHLRAMLDAPLLGIVAELIDRLERLEG